MIYPHQPCDLYSTMMGLERLHMNIVMILPLCKKIYDITHKDVMLKWLVMSFIERILDYCRALPTNSITAEAGLAKPFILEFNEVED